MDIHAYFQGFHEFVHSIWIVERIFLEREDAPPMCLELVAPAFVVTGVFMAFLPIVLYANSQVWVCAVNRILALLGYACQPTCHDVEVHRGEGQGGTSASQRKRQKELDLRFPWRTRIRVDPAKCSDSFLATACILESLAIGL